MPYIEKSEREEVNEALDAIETEIESGDKCTPGIMNYIITRVCLAYLRRKGTCYTNLNEVVGILECVKQEFYRRLLTPYEELKKLDNGDVYDA